MNAIDLLNRLSKNRLDRLEGLTDEEARQQVDPHGLFCEIIDLVIDRSLEESKQVRLALLSDLLEGVAAMSNLENDIQHGKTPNLEPYLVALAQKKFAHTLGHLIFDLGRAYEQVSLEQQENKDF